jgi:hypothetical protein
MTTRTTYVAISEKTARRFGILVLFLLYPSVLSHAAHRRPGHLMASKDQPMDSQPRAGTRNGSVLRLRPWKALDRVQLAL